MTTTNTPEAGQQYRDTNSGHIMTITKVAAIGVYARNETDGFEGAYTPEGFAEDVADGTLVPIEPTAPEIYVPQIDDRVTITGGAYAGRTGTVDKDSEHSSGLRVKLDKPLRRGGRVRTSVWVFPIDLAPLPAAPQYVTWTDESTGNVWHLTDRDGQPVAAGEYRAQWSGHPVFRIDATPEVRTTDDPRGFRKPLHIWITWDGETRGYCGAEQLNLWGWMPEFPND